MVAVVGTLLALLVFFALFGIFLTQYVPLWMEENESQLSNQIQTALSTLKSGADDQYILGGIPTYSVPFTVASATVPLLAQPTVATISSIPGCPDGFYTSNGTPERIASCDFEHLAFSSTTCTAPCQDNVFNVTRATNYLEVDLPARYFTPLSYYFEDDGLAAAQTSGHQWMFVPPPLTITETAGNLTVRLSQLVLFGNATTFNGQGTKDVTSHYYTGTNVTSASRFETSTGAPRTFNLTLTLGVHAICGWYNYLNNTTYAALGPSSSTTWTLTGANQAGALTLSPPSLSTCSSTNHAAADLTLKIHNVNYATAFTAEEQITFNAGGL